MATKKTNPFKTATDKGKKQQDAAMNDAPKPAPNTQDAAPKTAAATPKRGRPASEQERVAFTTRVRADVRKRINIAAATYDVKPSDIIDALVDQYLDRLDWDRVGTDRH